MIQDCSECWYFERGTLSPECYNCEVIKDMRKKRKPTLVIDIDGVIATGTVKDVYSEEAGWAYENCTLVEGAKEALSELCKEYRIVLSSSRWKSDLRKTMVWIRENHLENYIEEVQLGLKPSAVAYIDDKGYRFESWEQTLKDFLDGKEKYSVLPEGVK